MKRQPMKRRAALRVPQYHAPRIPKKPARYYVHLTDAGAAALSAAPPKRLIAPTLDDVLDEGLGQSEVTRAARKAHAVMADRDRFSVSEVEGALLAYLPVLMSGILSDIERWTQGPVQQRPASFNRHLQSIYDQSIHDQAARDGSWDRTEADV